MSPAAALTAAFERDIAEAITTSLTSEGQVIRVYPKLVANDGGESPLEDDEKRIDMLKRDVERRSKMVADRKASTKAEVAALREQIAALNAESMRLNKRDTRIIAGDLAALKAMGSE